MKKHIPNILTLVNLLCGVTAIIVLLEGTEHWQLASYLIGVGALFDLLDGMVARALKVSNELGKQLDSLADMVTFGVAPALIAREAITLSLFKHHESMDFTMLETLLPYASFLLIAFSALRLAKFNIDTRQTKDFIGLPTPANALFWISIPLIVGSHFVQEDSSTYINILMDYRVLAGLCLLMSLLLVSNIRLFSMKVDSLSIKDNSWLLAFLVISGVLLFIMRFAALPLIILLYILLSLIKNRGLNEVQS